jgi:triosephosphate isomerase (TIM)
MGNSNRPTVIAGNWKMYKTIEETISFILECKPLIKDSTAYAFLAVPFTAVRAAAVTAKQTPFVIGAQNVSDAAEGAFTGEISAKMLKEAGARFVIIGHSERRQIYCETDELVNKKIRRALQEMLQPIVCVGETLAQREAGKTEEILKTQLDRSLHGLTKDEMKKLILAYEPIWAIGTQKTATPEIAQQAQKFCRQVLSHTWDPDSANQVVILYGGSVKAENAKALVDQPDIDGLLVGGASLSVESFSRIVNCQQKKNL